MKFKPIACPEGAAPAQGTLDTIPGLALLNVDTETGEADYQGMTEVWWDDQRTIQDARGRHMLQCTNGYDWAAEMTV